jgi:hypothetical protein
MTISQTQITVFVWVKDEQGTDEDEVVDEIQRKIRAVAESVALRNRGVTVDVV